MTEETEDLPPAEPRFARAAVISGLIFFIALQIMAAQRIGFAFEYPLDDVYIHLSMASEIARGGYGINSGEYTSAASSALYPALLSPLPDSVLQRYLPLIWNAVGLALTAWLWGSAILWAGFRGAFAWILAITGPLLIGSVSTAYTGMEHTLHAAASLAIVFGLARFLSDDRLNVLLFAGLLFSPLLRFEGLALVGVVLIVLLARRRYFGFLLAAVIGIVPVGAFIWYLQSLGLDPLPNSIQAKLALSEGGEDGFVAERVAKVVSNMTRFGGIAIATLASTALYFTALFASGQGRTMTFLGGLLAIGGAVALGVFQTGFGEFGALVVPMIGVVFLGQVLLAFQCLRGLREYTGDARWIWLGFALAAAALGHILLGQVGWMERYEHYAIAAMATGAVLLGGLVPVRRTLVSMMLVVLVAFSGAQYVIKSVMEYHWGSRAIYLQHHQMATFAKVFLNRNIAVNDIGWVAWGNPNYVLDLYGLANDEARVLRLSDAAPGWGGPLVVEREVSVIMIYEDWLGEAVAPEWVPLGKLTMNNARGFLGGVEVAFYAASFAEVPHAQAALREWNKTLQPDTCFVRHGEETCWEN